MKAKTEGTKISLIADELCYAPSHARVWLLEFRYPCYPDKLSGCGILQDVDFSTKTDSHHDKSWSTVLGAVIRTRLFGNTGLVHVTKLKAVINKTLSLAQNSGLVHWFRTTNITKLIHSPDSFLQIHFSRASRPQQALTSAMETQFSLKLL